MSNTSPHDRQELIKALTRRYFFKQAGIGLGGTALSLLLSRDLLAAAGVAGRPRPSPILWLPSRPCFPPKPRASFISSWQARLRIWTCSTTNPSCNSTTAN